MEIGWNICKGGTDGGAGEAGGALAPLLIPVSLPLRRRCRTQSQLALSVKRH